MSMRPVNQWLVPSMVTKAARTTDTQTTMTSNMLRLIVKSTLEAQPTRTMKGYTKMAIWMLDPTPTAMARSILFLAATSTAVMCSHALPAMGRMIIPMKDRLRPDYLLTSSMESERNSEQKATTTVVIVIMARAPIRE